MLSTDPRTPPGTPRHVPRCESLFYCLACGRTLFCDTADVLRHLGEPWPVCCGEEFTFYVGVDRHGRADPRPKEAFSQEVRPAG